MQPVEHELPFWKSDAKQPCNGVSYAFVQAVEKPWIGWKSERVMAWTAGRRRARRAGGRSVLRIAAVGGAGCRLCTRIYAMDADDRAHQMPCRAA